MRDLVAQASRLCHIRRPQTALYIMDGKLLKGRMRFAFPP